MISDSYAADMISRHGYDDAVAAAINAINHQKYEKLTAKARKQLEPSKFAIPASETSDGKPKLPIHDAAHVRNALARKNQVKGATCGPKCMARIRAAAKKFGVDVGDNDKKSAGSNEIICKVEKFLGEKIVDAILVQENETNTGYPDATQQGIKKEQTRYEACLRKMKQTGKSEAAARTYCRAATTD